MDRWDRNLRLPNPRAPFAQRLPGWHGTSPYMPASLRRGAGGARKSMAPTVRDLRLSPRTRHLRRTASICIEAWPKRREDSRLPPLWRAIFPLTGRLCGPFVRKVQLDGDPLAYPSAPDPGDVMTYEGERRVWIRTSAGKERLEALDREDVESLSAMPRRHERCRLQPDPVAAGRPFAVRLSHYLQPRRQRN